MTKFNFEVTITQLFLYMFLEMIKAKGGNEQDETFLSKMTDPVHSITSTTLEMQECNNPTFQRHMSVSQRQSDQCVQPTWCKGYKRHPSMFKNEVSCFGLHCDADKNLSVVFQAFESTRHQLVRLCCVIISYVCGKPRLPRLDFCIKCSMDSFTC